MAYCGEVGHGLRDIEVDFEVNLNCESKVTHFSALFWSPRQPFKLLGYHKMAAVASKLDTDCDWIRISYMAPSR